MTKTFFALFLQQEEVYQSAMSLMELETDVYLSGSEEEKYASAIKVSDLASELLDSKSSWNYRSGNELQYYKTGTV